MRQAELGAASVLLSATPAAPRDDLKEEGQFRAIAVLGLTMPVMTFAIVALAQCVFGRDFLGTRE